MCAAILGRADAVCELLAHPATDVNLRSPGDGSTAMSLAATDKIRHLLRMRDGLSPDHARRPSGRRPSG
jgi:hypothetical protein